MFRESVGKQKQMESLENDFFNACSSDFSQQNIGLLTGRSGTLFIQACLNELYKSNYYKEGIKENFNWILENIQESESIVTAYSGGICGFAFALRVVKPLLENDQEIDEILQEIDEALLTDVDYQIKTGNIDLIHGAIGSATYLLDQNIALAAEKIIKFLDETKQELDGEIKWSRYDGYNLHTDIIDFGLAHGNAGILFFLGKCYSENVMPENCLRLIKGILQFYDNNLMNYETAGSFYPAIVKLSNYGSKVDNTTRLGWCYGDLTILNTFLLIADIAKDVALRDKTIDMLLQTSERIEYKETFVEDAGLCHGSAGIALIYMNIYELTGNLKFKEIASFWIDKTYNYSNNKEYIGGYVFNLGESKIGSEITLLNGIGGVLSVMTAYENKRVSDWLSKVFFLKW